MIELLTTIATVGMFLIAFVTMIYSFIDRHKAKETVKLANKALNKAEEALSAARATLKNTEKLSENVFDAHILEGHGVALGFHSTIVLAEELKKLGSENADDIIQLLQKNYQKVEKMVDEVEKHRSKT